MRLLYLALFVRVFKHIDIQSKKKKFLMSACRLPVHCKRGEYSSTTKSSYTIQININFFVSLFLFLVP